MSVSNTETYGMYPVTYTASPEELRRWEDQGVETGLDDQNRKLLGMMHAVLNAPGVGRQVDMTPDAMVMKFADVRVEQSS